MLQAKFYTEIFFLIEYKSLFCVSIQILLDIRIDII